MNAETSGVEDERKTERTPNEPIGSEREKQSAKPR
jgi:hypothetical protein